MKPRILIGIVLLLLVAVIVWMRKDIGDSRFDIGKDSDGRRPTLQGGVNSRDAGRVREREERSVVRDESSVGEERDRNVPAPLAPPVERMASLGAPPAGARVKVGGKAYDLLPNQLGEFQRVYLEKGGSAEVAVRYPEGKTGDKVAVAILDGGTVEEKTESLKTEKLKGEDAGNERERGPMTAITLELDKSLALHFTAQTTAEGGLTRVLLTKGGDRKIIDLWGGTESPLKSEVSAE